MHHNLPYDYSLSMHLSRRYAKKDEKGSKLHRSVFCQTPSLKCLLGSEESVALTVTDMLMDRHSKTLSGIFISCDFLESKGSPI